jgi:selenocysteine-specific elongation factor
VRSRPGAGDRPRLAIDRSFRVRGRGTVVTGSLRGGRVATGATLRLVPGDDEVRVREVQVRGATVPVSDGGRTALLAAGVDAGSLGRGRVLTADAGVVATSRVLVALRSPAGLTATGPVSVPADRERLRIHLGTAQAGTLVVRGPRESIDLSDGTSLAILRLDDETAASAGDPFALRRPSPAATAGGGTVLDPRPPRGVSRRRLTATRAEALATAVTATAHGDAGAGDALAAALLDLHGAVRRDGGWRLAPDVASTLATRALETVRAYHETEPSSPGLPLPALRADLARLVRRLVTLDRTAAEEVARAEVERLVRDGIVARDGERLRDPSRAAGLPPATLEAMDRLEQALSAPAPPGLAGAAREAGCPPDGVRALETAGRIVRLEDDLAWAAGTYRDLVRRALAMAAAGPLSPAAFRDATGTSRRYVLVVLEDLDRRGLLRRTEAGHVLGPVTLARLKAKAAREPGP